MMYEAMCVPEEDVSLTVYLKHGSSPLYRTITIHSLIFTLPQSLSSTSIRAYPSYHVANPHHPPMGPRGKVQPSLPSPRFHISALEPRVEACMLSPNLPFPRRESSRFLANLPQAHRERHQRRLQRRVHSQIHPQSRATGLGSRCGRVSRQARRLYHRMIPALLRSLPPRSLPLHQRTG